MKIEKINLCKTSVYRRCSTSGLPWQQASGFSYTDINISSVQSLSCIRLFVTPRTAAHQAFLCITNSWSLLKLMSIESVMPSNHLILCHPLLLLSSIFPSIKVFSNESALCIRGQSTGVSASASVFPMNIQDWFPLGWTGWISLQSKGLSRVFSNPTVQKHQFSVLSLLYGPTHIHVCYFSQATLKLLSFSVFD